MANVLAMSSPNPTYTLADAKHVIRTDFDTYVVRIRVEDVLESQPLGPTWIPVDSDKSDLGSVLFLNKERQARRRTIEGM